MCISWRILAFGCLAFSGFFVDKVFAANILCLSTLASPSHFLWNKIVSTALIERGHNITILTPDKDKGVALKNFNVITMEDSYEVLFANFVIEEVLLESTITSMISVYDFVKSACQHYINTKGLETLLNYPKDFKFDLIIVDVTYGQCLYPFIERFNNPPVVAVTAFKLPSYLSYSFGNHLYSSYMPYYNSDYTSKMSFTQRILNFLFIYFELFYRNYIISAAEFSTAQKRFGKDIRRFDEVEKNMSLLLTNIDPIFDDPISLPPNIIPIGGLHIKPPKQLPEEFLKIMNSAKHGVILFSLGTNIQFHTLTIQRKSALLNGLAKFPQTILWKTDADHIEGLPKNIVIKKWLPQNDILGHPATKLFITHGGCLSTQEAMYHGVPVVSVPFIIDQRLNARQLEQRKLGTVIDITNITAESVYQAVNDVLTNPSYTQNMKTISKLYRDQPQTALDRGIFWIEYVMRHGSAQHLVSPARHMPFYQLSNLDVAAVLLLCLFLVYNLLMFVVTTLKFILTFGRNKQ